MARTLELVSLGRKWHFGEETSEHWSQWHGGCLKGAGLQRNCSHAGVTSQSGEEQDYSDVSPFATFRFLVNAFHWMELLRS